MFHNKAKLTEVFDYFGFDRINLKNNDRQITRVITKKEQINALLSYLNLAGYLADNLLVKAINYLAISKNFLRSNDIVIGDLIKARNHSHNQGGFNPECFINELEKIDYLMIDDCLDLIVFLQQTAFDRQFGVERDCLQQKAWIASNVNLFIDIITTLGVATPLPPSDHPYLAIGIMGASLPRVKQRIEYFKSLDLDSTFILALTGKRELSVGLDRDKEQMEEIAVDVGMPISYVKKTIGADTREYLDGITETMMVNYLIRTTCADRKITIVDSQVQSGHWRATTSQSATDVTQMILERVKENKALHNTEQHVLIIAEQPYASRMNIQIQREFNKQIEEAGLADKIKINIDAAGPGLTEYQLNDVDELTRVNSELAALMAERFHNARLKLQNQKPNITLRNAELIMFSTRDKKYNEYQMTDQHVYTNRIA